MFVQSTLHQLKVAVDTSIQMLNQYTESDLKIKPIESKRSLFEMCTHLALICHADLLILNGITEKELHTFYIEHTLKQLLIYSKQCSKDMSYFLKLFILFG